MTAPTFTATDEATSDLLDLIAEDHPPTPSPRDEWDHYCECLRRVAIANAGLIRPNELRPLVRGVVKPSRVGAFCHRAMSRGLVVRTGDWEVSDDRAGRNSGRPAPIMRALPALYASHSSRAGSAPPRRGVERPHTRPAESDTRPAGGEATASG